MLGKSAKGQTFMPDYIASLLIFAVVVAIFIGSWEAILTNQSEFDEERVMTDQAIHTTTFLVSTPGYPEDWEDTGSPSIPGFAEEDHVLSQEKLRQFRNIPYQDQSRLMQTQNFYLKIYNDTQTLQLDGTDLEYGTSFTSAETVVPIERNIIYNKSGEMIDAKMRYVAWR